MSATEAYEADVTSRMGMVPHFFTPEPDAPEVVRLLWEFAKATYIESPIPSPFKDRLFVYLSRFCEVRYCVARHCAFLVAGETLEADLRIAAVKKLLRAPPPWDSNFDDVLAALATRLSSEDWPTPESDGEDLVIAVATSIFVEPRGSEPARLALRKAIGPARLEHLLLFLTFIRTAHFWTLVHPELTFEDDVHTLLRANAELATLLLVDKEAGRLDMGARLFEELTELRDLHEKRELETAKRELEVQLYQQEMLLKDVRAVEQELARKDERLQMALTASGAVGLWDWMVESDLLHGDANFARLYGLDVSHTAAGLTMEQYQQFVVPEDLRSLRESIRGVFEREENFLVEYRLAVPGQPLRWVECRGRMIADDDGEPARFSGTAVDITERKTGEEQKHLLMTEMSHRVKNTFAMVQSIVVQTLKGTDQQVLETLQSRLAALGGAHDILLQAGWSVMAITDLVAKVLGLNTEGDLPDRRAAGSTRARCRIVSVLIAARARDQCHQIWFAISRWR